MAQQQHPYAPQSLVLPGYVPNLLSSAEICSSYGLVALALCIVLWCLTGRAKHLVVLDRLLICWVAFTGITHMVFEGYFVFVPNFYQTRSPMLLAEAWKLYSKADSRYASRHSTLVAIESILSLGCGPASLLAIYGIIARKCYTHPLLLLLFFTEILCVSIYLLTGWLDGNSHASEPFYFWGYYVLLNFLYGIAIPIPIVLRSWSKICQVFEFKSLKEH